MVAETRTHKAGGSVYYLLPPGVTGTAEFNDDGRYRRVLTRRWRDGDRFALWIGMNPSTADERGDDPTVRREWICTREELWKHTPEQRQFDRYVKVNVADFVATAPRELVNGLKSGTVLLSDANFDAIMAHARQAGVVVLAFGTLAKVKPLHSYAARIIAALEAEDIGLYCRGVTKDGSPRHALYLRSDAPFVPFERGSYQP